MNRKYSFCRPGIVASVRILALIAIVLGSQSLSSYAQTERLSNSLIGRDFWFAIPPTIGDRSVVEIEHLFIFVTPLRDTRVTLEYLGADGARIERDGKAMEQLEFSTRDQAVKYTWEVIETEQRIRKAIHIFADEPLVVNVVPARNRASEGFVVFPSDRLGYSYRHLSYYDRQITPQDQRSGGFLIVAKEDGTEVDIALQGIGEGETAGGREFGELNFRETLNRGEVYMVRGRGDTEAGIFDLSGTFVETSKPAAFISFHQQVNTPAAAANGALGGLAEMMPPIDTWGKRYVALEFQSAQNNQTTHYRLMGNSERTNFTVFSYNPNSRELIEQKPGTLENAGDLRSYEDIDPWLSPGAYLKGVTVWDSEDPVQLMAYSSSDNWNAVKPHMSIVPPVEQMVQSSLFQTPPERFDAKNNQIHIFAVGNPDEADESPFASIRIGGETLTQSFGLLFNKKLPEDNIWYARFRIEPGQYVIEGDYPFSAYLYGEFDWGGYGYPIAMALNNIKQLDSIAPRLSMENVCSRVEITATDNFDGDPDDAPRQIDQGISDVGLIKSQSINAELEHITDPAVLGRAGVRVFRFLIKAIDPRDAVVAVVQVLDRAGNLTTANIELPPSTEILELDRRRENFGDVRVGVIQERVVQIVNPSGQELEIQKIEIPDDGAYIFIDKPSLPHKIASAGSLDLTIAYLPTREDQTGEKPDTAEVIVSTVCNDFVAGTMVGRGVKSDIRVSQEWDAGEVTVGEEVCNEDGIEIVNDGTATLTVESIEIGSQHFTGDQVTPSLPVDIEPNASLVLTGMCFKPAEADTFEVIVKINIDDGGGAQPYVTTWRGVGVKETDVVDHRVPGYILRSAHPNPAVGSELSIGYTLGQAGATSLMLFDALGNRLSVLVDEYQGAGEYRLKLDTRQLTAGVYHYRLQSGLFRATERIVIAR